MSETSQIQIKRLHGGRDKQRRYKVKIDGEVRASLKPGGSAKVDVPAGRHSIAVRIDWLGSEEQFFDSVAGETLSFECCAARETTSIVDLFRRDSYVKLFRAVPSRR